MKIIANVFRVNTKPYLWGIFNRKQKRIDCYSTYFTLCGEKSYMKSVRLTDFVSESLVTSPIFQISKKNACILLPRTAIYPYSNRLIPVHVADRVVVDRNYMAFSVLQHRFWPTAVTTFGWAIFEEIYTPSSTRASTHPTQSTGRSGKFLTSRITTENRF